MADRVPRASADALAEPRPLTSAQISAVERFPDDNPNPVLRVAADGRLIYANHSSRLVLAALGAVVGEPLSAETLARLESAAASGSFIEVVAEHRTFAVWPVKIPDLGFTNLYGRDMTAERAIVKFPDQNPHPVLRIGRDGGLLYANPASTRLVTGLGLELGRRLPAELLASVLAHAGMSAEKAFEVVADGCHYELLPVDVPEFGFINVYGTDVTAARERERLARENERLLLNILPEPIARRLRGGEPLIADRFDDVTLLFADIVEFTRLSALMTASELVRVLNEVFTVFDELVERHDLEKVKTIGDAYMIVGGLPEPSPDHAARVASMALDLTETLEQIGAASRLGVRFRIGMHCGPVVAGVIGRKRFIYDVWGDTVNLASRMESLGIPGRIQVTGAVVDRLGSMFSFEPRGLIDVKGKGPMPTWFLNPTGGRAGVVDAGGFVGG